MLWSMACSSDVNSELLADSFYRLRKNYGADRFFSPLFPTNRAIQNPDLLRFTVHHSTSILIQTINLV